MEYVDAGLQVIKVHDVTPGEGSIWLHSSYPFRIPLDIKTQLNAISAGETISTPISIRFVEANKIREDLADIVVARHDGKHWEVAPSYSEYLEDGVDIMVHFEALESITDSDIYYIFFGNSTLSYIPVVEPFEGEEFFNTITLHTPFVSFTNPSQDWEVNVDHIIGLRTGAKFFCEISTERFKLYGGKGPEGGIIDIKVNGIIVGIVDLFSDEEIEDIEIFSYEAPIPGTLQVMVEISNQKNVSSSGNVIRLNNIRFDTFAHIENGPEEINPRLDWISNVGAKS